MEDPSTFVARITLCEEYIVLIWKDGLPFFQTKFDCTIHIHKLLALGIYNSPLQRHCLGCSVGLGQSIQHQLAEKQLS